MTSLRSLMQRRYVVPALLCIFFTVMLTGLKMVRLDQEHGDAAMYYQITDNISTRGVPVTSVSNAVIDFLAQKIPFKSAQEISADPLVPKLPAESDYFRLHANYVFYPIAVLAKILPARFVLLSLFVLSFTGIVLFAYFLLRARGIPIAAAGLFCLLVVYHPAWSSAFEWQFYPERLFVLAGFTFMALASRNVAGRASLIVTGILCASISERAAILAGVFLLLYTLLYWKTASDRPFKLGLGAASLMFGVFVLKMGIANPEYSGFLPTSLGELVARFHSPKFVQDLTLFGLVNLVLLAVALFEWRASVIAVVFMLPNVVGTLGGAEKVGWITHYHDFYLPALVWAALAGFVAAYRMATAHKRLPVFYAGTCLLILFLGSIDPTAAAKISISPAHLGNNFFASFVNDSDYYFGPAGRALASSYEDLGRAIPEHTVVSAPESAMSELYHARTLRFFPMSIDSADYAILGFTPGTGGTPIYSGDIPYFIGAAETRRVDDVIVARMKKDHYDFAHPVLIQRIGLAVLKRLHEKP